MPPIKINKNQMMIGGVVTSGESFEEQLLAANKALTPSVTEEEFNQFPSSIGSFQILQSLGQGSYGQ